ncbi:MAG TPA: cyclic pyranopterin monophosphate synthase MoaC [Chloroflexota bacterium]|nr:cyclic pyranopterin monophosphate synthase MoaC [Chloroflexota bacterium]
MTQLSHIDEHGRARMVDVSAKDDTLREAIATGEITMRRETLDMIVNQRPAGSGMAPSGATELQKGDVLATAQIAGIMAAKRTWELIPMCHQLLITGVSVDFDVDFERAAISITGTARTRGKTGVEMEALTAVCVAGLTIYDMVKAVDQTMEIGSVQLTRKTGGKSDLSVGHA